MEDKMPTLEGRTAVITGGASGIGYAIAGGLAREGANVVIADIHPALEQSARELSERSGRAVIGMRMDVTDPAQVEQTMAAVVEQYGGLHILGNIAGIYKRHTVIEMTPSQWDQTLNINLRGVFLCTHFALPYMVRQGYGRIISIASGIAVLGGASGSAYAASKAGVIAFTKSVAGEVFEAGIRVNCLAPGITDTPLMRQANTPEDVERAVARSGRPLGKPEDVVGPFLFLLSDAASMMSGVTLWLKNP
jgi:NAD(P)-dependent dehydrogenase (short-subunit alcohol dehydrogenase family)